MKLLKMFAITLTVFAVLFIGAVAYLVLDKRDVFTTNSKPGTTASPGTPNDAHNAVQQTPLEASPSTTTDAMPAQPSSTQPADEPSPVSSPEPDNVQPTPNEPEAQEPSTLIIGRWQAANNPNSYFEFFQNGTFTRGTYEAKDSYNEFSGTYAFSSHSRMKLQYEKWTVEVPGYKNTREDDTSHVFDISIDAHTLSIPDAIEKFGTSEWTKVE
ncbi:hypothetical protein DUZ99_10065 [Xylanibacillus composti]|uniref:Uncharacterized protein n=1 Tax=Xylanibacillus composti TaxID=1572762 RepID=A0A8J4H7G4_9BACL|nr:hypothetical protein [Xylanibacillus composti]MDT9725316.1 hypothetical protein [Xylanibacillus composti]GIQ71187.1 hypothetical protein XYCOK13_40110 [Xylanibacillus composti]